MRGASVDERGRKHSRRGVTLGRSMVKVKEGSVKVFHKNKGKKSPFIKQLLHYTNEKK